MHRSLPTFCNPTIHTINTRYLHIVWYLVTSYSSSQLHHTTLHYASYTTRSLWSSPAQLVEGLRPPLLGVLHVHRNVPAGGRQVRVQPVVHEDLVPRNDMLAGHQHHRFHKKGPAEIQGHINIAIVIDKDRAMIHSIEKTSEQTRQTLTWALYKRITHLVQSNRRP